MEHTDRGGSCSAVGVWSDDVGEGVEDEDEQEVAVASSSYDGDMMDDLGYMGDGQSGQEVLDDTIDRADAPGIFDDSSLEPPLRSQRRQVPPDRDFCPLPPMLYEERSASDPMQSDIWARVENQVLPFHVAAGVL